jgi:hypothetical protein
MEERLCTCQTAWTHHQNPLLRNDILPPWEPRGVETTTRACREAVAQASAKAVKQLETITESWPEPAPGCRFRQASPSPAAAATARTEEKALRESVQSRGDPRRLAEFHRKLESCSGDNPVSIAILGGSVTAGHTCEGKHITETDFLGLPDASLLDSKMSSMIRGNEHCPWANRLKTLWGGAHPSCKFIDVYNLAMGATDTQWALSDALDKFPLENSARGGARLGDVVDLVIVEYGVNDGFLKSHADMMKLNLPFSWDAGLGRIEAVTEYLFESLLSLPAHPAVMYLETGTPATGMSSSPAHLEAAERFGVPFARCVNCHCRARMVSVLLHSSVGY